MVYAPFMAGFASGYLEARMKKSLRPLLSSEYYTTPKPSIKDSRESCEYCDSIIKLGILNCQNCGAAIKRKK